MSQREPRQYIHCGGGLASKACPWKIAVAAVLTPTLVWLGHTEHASALAAELNPCFYGHAHAQAVLYPTEEYMQLTAMSGGPLASQVACGHASRRTAAAPRSVSGLLPAASASSSVTSLQSSTVMRPAGLQREAPLGSDQCIYKKKKPHVVRKQRCQSQGNTPPEKFSLCRRGF